VITSPTRHHSAKFGYNQFKGGVAAHARNLPLGIYFFLSFFFLRKATDQPVEPIDAADGSNEASWRRIHSLYIHVDIYSRLFTTKAEQKKKRKKHIKAHAEAHTQTQQY